jgi:hypothetical protein
VVSLNVFHPSRVINHDKDRKRIVSQDGYALESQPVGGDDRDRRYSLSPVRPKHTH